MRHLLLMPCLTVTAKAKAKSMIDQTQMPNQKVPVQLAVQLMLLRDLKAIPMEQQLVPLLMLLLLLREPRGRGQREYACRTPVPAGAQHLPLPLLVLMVRILLLTALVTRMTAKATRRHPLQRKQLMKRNRWPGLRVAYPGTAVAGRRSRNASPVSNGR